MISNELSTIQAKDADRAMIAAALAGFSGTITVIDKPVVRVDAPGDWRRTLSLPGSASVDNLDKQETAMVEAMRALAEKGVGISGMKYQLKADPRRLRRLAKMAGIVIPSGRKSQTTHLGEKARAARVQSGKTNRATLAERLAPLAARGLTIQAMHEETGASKRTVMRTLEEHAIKRGPKTNLEA